MNVLQINSSARRDASHSTRLASRLVERLREATPESKLTVIARPTLPVNSIGDLIALAKSKPGTLNYGAAGVGTHVYLTAELLRKIAGFEAVHEPD